MGSPLSVCTRHGDIDYSWTAKPCDIISANTTPEEFEAEWTKNPHYKLSYLNFEGLTALHKAAKLGNRRLIEHLVSKTGMKILMSIGDITLQTPLVLAIKFNQRSAVKRLIDLGANVNMLCTDFTISYDWTTHHVICANVILKSPLAFAVELTFEDTNLSGYDKETLKLQKVAMAKLLLIHEATMMPKAEEEGLQVWQQAQKEIDETRVSLIQDVFTATQLDSKTVTTIVDYFPLDEIPETVPELPASEITSMYIDDPVS